MKWAVLIVIVFLFFSTLHAQPTEKSGNLLRIAFNSQNVDLSDTLGGWFQKTGFEYNSNSRFGNVFHFSNEVYFLSSFYYDDYFWPSSGTILESPALPTPIGLYGSTNAIDYIGPDLFQELQILPLKTGVWFLVGTTENLFLDSNKNIISKESLEIKVNHIPGMINQSYLVLTGEFEEVYLENYTYSLCNLNNSPFAEPIQNIEVALENGDEDDAILLLKIREINDSTFFVAANYNGYNNYSIERTNFRLAHFKDTTLTLLSNNFENENLTYWVSFENRIVGLRDGNLFGQTLNPNSLQFEKIDTLAKNVSNYSISVDRKFSTFTRNDSLFAFSLNNELLINSWSLEEICTQYTPMIDSPYVYIHQVTTVVGVEEENELPNEISLSQNYPNPFNPITTISLSIPNPQFTILKVYDILGREIRTLLNKPLQPGEYEIEFDGSTLTSGVYFYVLETGTERLRKKMILLK